MATNRSKTVKTEPFNPNEPTEPLRSSWTDYDGAELTALIAEYGTLRQESMNTITNRIAVMTTGLAGIIALATGALIFMASNNNHLVTDVVFCGMIPLVCIYIILVWLSEATRSYRAGRYLSSNIEFRINKKFEKSLMAFETSLWNGALPRDRVFGPSMMALSVFGIICGFSPWIGLCASTKISTAKIALHIGPAYSIGLILLAYSAVLMNSYGALATISADDSSLNKNDGQK